MYKIHYHPKSGWINDPNGLHYSNEIYHMFYQYYPDDIIWGPMHWGYAVSKDLIKWEEQEIALYPDELGYIFSGSAVIDKNNVSGLFDEKISENDRKILFYTNHLSDGNKENEKVEQMQSLAYFTENGYKKYENNPIIASNGRKDFRDPKVFYYEKENKWIMVVSCADKAEIYESKNLIDWDFASDFKYDFSYNHIWECPDLFKVGEKWILVGSMINSDNRIESEVVYFIGNFDGKTFSLDEKKYDLVDYGLDYYAPQSFFGTEKVTTQAWLNNWVYAKEIPASKYRGIMGVSRELELKNGKLIQKKVENFYNYLGEKTKLEKSQEIEKNVYLQLKNNGNFEIKLFDGEIEIIYENKNFKIKRGIENKKYFNDSFISQKQIDVEVEKIDIVIDYNVVEIFINDGEKVLTYLVYPEKYNIELNGNIEGETFKILGK